MQHFPNQDRPDILPRKLIVWSMGLALAAGAGCSSSGVAPSKTASGAGTGALIGGTGGAVVGNNSSLGSTAGILGGVGLGAIAGGIIGMVQDAKDRKEQDRLAQERAYQQQLAKSRLEEARTKASLEEELAIAEGFRISDLELNDAKRKQESTSDRLKKLKDERSAALAKKKELDNAHEKTLSDEAEIARLEEEIARLKGDDGAKKPDTAAGKTSPAAKPGI